MTVTLVGVRHHRQQLTSPGRHPIDRGKRARLTREAQYLVGVAVNRNKAVDQCQSQRAVDRGRAGRRKSAELPAAGFAP